MAVAILDYSDHINMAGVIVRYDRDRKERTRERVVAEAARAIRTEGPDGMGVAAVRASAGLTHGGFYAHFASKDDLIVAALAQLSGHVLANFDRLTTGKAPSDALRAYIDFYLSAQHRDARERGCPLPALSADLPRSAIPAAREWFSRCITRLAGALTVPIAALGHPEPDALASSVLAELIGALSMARGVADPKPSGMLLRRSRQQLKARLGFDGPE